jgi:hypothetical protein
MCKRGVKFLEALVRKQQLWDITTLIEHMTIIVVAHYSLFLHVGWDGMKRRRGV